MVPHTVVVLADDPVPEVPDAGKGVVLGAFGRYLGMQMASREVFQRKVVSRIVIGAEAFQIHEAVVLQLVVHIVAYLHLSPRVVFLLKLHPHSVGVGQHPLAQFQGQDRNEAGRQEEGKDKPMVADTAGENGHHFRILRHLGSEEYHRQEHEHGGILVDEVRNPVHVIIEDYLVEGGFPFDEVFNLFTDIEDDDEHRQEEDGHKERHQEFPDDVPVQPLESLELGGHRRCVSLGITAFFQERKSPARMCSRATRTRSR